MLDKVTPTGTLTRPLRIGVLGNHLGLKENWQVRVLDRLKGDPRFQLTAILIHPDAFPVRSEPLLFRYVSQLEQALLPRERQYVPRHFDRWAERLELLPSSDTNALDEDKARAFIESLQLDLVIRMVPAELPQSIVSRFPFGEWSFSFMDERSELSDWAGFADVASGRPSTGLSLCLRQNGTTRCIASASFNIKFSAVRNAGFVKERAVTLLMRELGRLADTGRLDPIKTIPEQSSVPPTALDLARYAAKFSSSMINRAAKTFKAKAGIGSTVWTLYVGEGNIADFDPAQATEIPPSKEEIRADPFLFVHDGATYLFYEAYSAGAKKAHIAVGRLDAGKLVPLGPALVKDHHLSYPFVFRHDGEIYMMPETNQARRIEIWRCVEFPLKWELYSTALEGKSPADSVLTCIDGRWWLFTNLSDFHAYEDHCSELHIFEVDGPAMARVVPHQRNPVIIDSTVARNAGRIFSIDGKVYRPSQRNECGIYGYGLNIMEIETLDLQSYRERCVRIIRPDFKPGLMGCHHFDAAGGQYVIDARLGH